MKNISRIDMKKMVMLPNNTRFLKFKRDGKRGTVVIFEATPYSAQGVLKGYSDLLKKQGATSDDKAQMKIVKKLPDGDGGEPAGNQYEIWIDYEFRRSASSELVRLAKHLIAGGDISIPEKLADSYMEIGREAFKNIKTPRGVDKMTPLRERNRSNNTFSFMWEYEGYTRSDFTAKAEISIVMYTDGDVFATVKGERPDWGRHPTNALDEQVKWTVPLAKIQGALDRIFG